MEETAPHIEDAEATLEEDAEDSAEAEKRLSSGASWFYWVAALSLVNSVILLFGGEWSFLFGLGITQVVDAIAMGVGQEVPESATVAKIVGFSLNLVIAGTFVILGWLAHRRKQWPFILGILLYVIDALILLLVGDFLGLAFHAWVLFRLVQGFRACRELTRLEIGGLEAVTPR